MPANFDPWVDSDGALGFALFGLDRQEYTPDWVPMRWDLQTLHLGPGTKVVADAIEYGWPEWDFEKLGAPTVLNSRKQFPHQADSVGGVVATHVLEHLQDPRPLIAEVARILVPGAPFNILVPHGKSNMYLQDLDHKTPFILDTWRLLLENPYYDTRYGQQKIPLSVGANFTFAIKEGNEALITQLIKNGVN